MKKAMTLLLTVILAAAAFAACDFGGNNGDPLFQVTDFRGKTIDFDKTADRIISFGPADTSIILDLGVKNKLVAKSKLDSIAELEEMDIPAIDGYILNAEEIISLMPDVIFSAPNSGADDIFTQLETKGIKIIILDAVSVADIYRKIDIIAKVTGAEAKGGELKTKIQGELQAVKDGVNEGDRKSVYVELDSYAGLYSCGLTSFVNEILELAGCVNALKQILTDNNLNGAWVNISEEQVIMSDPYAIICPDYGYDTEETIAAIKTRAGFGATDAVSNGRVYAIDANLLSQAGPKVADLAKAIHDAVYGN